MDSIKKSAPKKGRRAPPAPQSPSTPTSPDLDINFDISLDSEHQVNDNQIPPRRIAGGWADSASKKTRTKNLIEDERFKKSLDISSTEDDIPIIPDLDDIQDELLMNEIVEPPSVSVNRVVTLKELNSDLLTQKAFSSLEDVDLSILTKCLQPQSAILEDDEPWEWDKIFTEVVAEISMENPVATTIKDNDEIGYSG